MPKFRMTYPSGKVEEEVVFDTDINHYINRKFGSVDPHEHGVTVEEIPLNDDDKAFVAEVTQAASNPANVIVDETMPKNYTLQADTLHLEAELHDPDTPA